MRRVAADPDGQAMRRWQHQAYFDFFAAFRAQMHHMRSMAAGIVPMVQGGSLLVGHVAAAPADEGHDSGV
jgi:hypothetical protein